MTTYLPTIVTATYLDAGGVEYKRTTHVVDRFTRRHADLALWLAQGERNTRDYADVYVDGQHARLSLSLGKRPKRIVELVEP